MMDTFMELDNMYAKMEAQKIKAELKEKNKNGK